MDDPIGADAPPTGVSAAEQNDAAEEAGSARDGVRRALMEVGERVDEIITGAERAAEDVRRRAQADAERYLAERRRRADALEAERSRRFQEALGELRSGVGRIGDEAERVVQSVEEAIGRAADAEESAGEAPIATPATPAPPPGPRPIAYPGRASREPDGEPMAEPRVSMLIRATQLAVQGHERVEIEQTLESEFGAADVGQIVDEVLGHR